jgi:Domain of unknown function (DUF397)
MPAADDLVWRTSTHSSDGESCVEVAAAANSIFIRDTKCRSAGTISLPRSAWRNLVSRLDR